jgi:hypothetical protein
MPPSSPNSRAPRVLYLPNEAKPDERFGQAGGRAAFREMHQSGLIQDLSIYSFLADYLSDKNTQRTHQKLVETVRAFQPDILFWQHPNRFPIDQPLMQAIRTACPSMQLVYHEADPFDRLYKPIRQCERVLYTNSDVFFTVGLGAGRKLFEEIRPHPHIYHCPSTVERERFATPAEPGMLASKYDAVMLGTIAARWRIIKQPESGKRVQLARGLTKLFGDRFACFGAGWPSGTNCQGPFPYEKQTEIIQQSRMSVIWDLYPNYTFYFSDRLPIALAAGRPFITSTHAGYDTLLPNVPGLFHVSSVDEAIDTAVHLRGLPLDEIAAMGAAARTWMLENLEARLVFRNAFDICLRVWRGQH